MRTLISRFSAKTIHVRLFVLILLILAGSFFILGFQQWASLTSAFRSDALEKARSDLRTGMALVDALYPGDWQIRDGMLYKGETLFNDHHEAVDLIGELTDGDAVTLFLGVTRVATNVVVDGKRAVDTHATGDVVEEVLRKGQSYAESTKLSGKTVQAAYMPIRDADGRVIGMWQVAVSDSNEQVRQLKLRMMLRLAITGACLMTVGFLLFLICTRPMIKRIQDSVRLLQVIAGGDFTSGELQAKSEDETGMLQKAVNKMSREIRAVIGRVKDTSSQVASSSGQLSASIAQASQATGQIHEAIQEVAAGMDEQLTAVTHSTEAVLEISKGMDQVADAILHMADFSAAVSSQANLGSEVVLRSVEQMSTIKQTVGQAAQIIRALDEKSKQIDEIAVAIAEIASQTNLLALNASIEAARAGEHGKGFAVVAGEVKKLADQSARSAERVAELIGQIQGDTRQAVLAINQGMAVVEKGVDHIQQTGGTFSGIAEAIDEISGRSQEVSAVVEQVHANTQETAARMERMTEILETSSANIHQIAALLEEQTESGESIAAAAVHLNELAEQLQLLVKTFKA